MTDDQKAKQSARGRAYYERNKAIVKARAKEWKAANPETVKTGAKVYRDTHQAEMKALQDAWAARNPDRVLAKSHRHYYRNAVALRAKSSAYHHANKTTIRQKMAAYRQTPGFRAIAHKHRERREKGLTTGTLSRDIIPRLHKLQRGLCPCCAQPLGDDYHLDHVTPLSKGGINADENVQLLRSGCNLSKHAKDPIDFMQERGFLL